MGGLLIPKERLIISAASKLELEADVLEEAIGIPAYSVGRNDAQLFLKRFSTGERRILAAPSSYIGMWEQLTADPDLERAVGYPDGESIRWLLIDRDGRVHTSLSLPLFRNEPC